MLKYPQQKHFNIFGSDIGFPISTREES